jgi:hypothetical protein
VTIDAARAFSTKDFTFPTAERLEYTDESLSNEIPAAANNISIAMTTIISIRENAGHR